VGYVRVDKISVLIKVHRRYMQRLMQIADEVRE
jgi:hypothetical protein